MSFLQQLRAAPNLLTLLRLFIIPFLVIQILDHQYALALLLFVLAGISDGLDGRIARWLGQSTRLGQYLDPIADKLMLSTVFLTITHMGLIPRYVAVLVFSRDFGILLISTLLYATNTLRDFRPSLLGKLNTFAQILTVLGVLLQQVWNEHLLQFVNARLIIAIAWLAPLSAAQYAWITTRRISDRQPPLPA
jgi:cardiolipin synthase